MSIDYNIRHLSAFIALSQRGSVKAAAASLALSQSTISTTLTEFERLFNCQLFIRSGRKLILSSDGKRLLPYALSAVTSLGEMSRCINDSSDSRISGELVIGASSTIANYIIPHILSGYLAINIGVTVRLFVGNTQRIATLIDDHVIDIGFVEGLCHNSEIVARKWAFDEMVVFCGPKHELFHCRQDVTIDGLKKLRWVMREQGSGSRDVFEHVIRNLVEQLHIVMEIGSTESVILAVESGIGVGCLSRHAIASRVINNMVREVAVPALNLNRQFSIIHHKSVSPGFMSRSFLEYCETETCRKIVENVRINRA